MKMTHFALAGLFLLLAAGIYLTVQSDMDGRMAQQQADFDRMRAESDKKLEQLEKAIREQKAPASVADASQAVDAGMPKAKKGTAKSKTVTDPEYPDAAVGTALANVANSLQDGAGNLTGATRTETTIEVSETVDSDTERILAKEQREVLNNSGVGTERIALDTAEVTGALPEDATVRLTNLQSLIMAQPAIARVENANAAANEGFVILDRGLNANLAKGDAFAVRRGTALIGRVTVGDTIEETRCVAEVVAKKLVQGMVLQKGDEIIKFDQ